MVLAAVETSRAADRLMRAAMERSVQLDLVAGLDRRKLAARTAEIRRAVNPHQVSFRALRQTGRNRLSLARSISFRAKIHESAEARFVKDVKRPTWRLDPKHSAYEFVDAIGARRPRSDKQQYSLDEVPKTAPGVLKATQATGSRGCYLIYSPERVVHILDQKSFGSIDEAMGHARGLIGDRARPIRDEWMWEEMILEDSMAQRPARDLKFYAFYGEILLMRESVYVDGKTRVAYWDASGVQSDMGHPQDYDFDRVGFTEADAQVVSEISAQIPHPYCRIDMLKGEGELVLGEFTPHPGNFDEFTDEWDRRLGEAWVRAESRLMGDLLRGKSFKPFLDATGLLD